MTAEPATLVPRISRDDDRLARLLVRHFDFVWRLLLRLGVEHGRVQDEAQRTFQIVHTKLGHVPETHERSFLVGVATRVAANARRSQARVREEPRGDEIELWVDSKPGPEELVDHKRRRECLDRILGQLSFEQRVVFVLSELEGMSRQEIAAHLELPLGTVASRLRLAKQHFGRLVARLQAELSACHQRGAP